MNKKKSSDRLKQRFGELLFISFLVGIKLVLSYFVPGLKTPGELIWTGSILLLFCFRSFREYKKISNLT